MNLYAQILDIIQEALFGVDAVLTANQIFLTEQAALWLALGVLLCPIIAMLALTVKLLKW